MKQRGHQSILTFSAVTLCLSLAGASNANAQAENANCKADIAVFCAQVAPGEGRIAQCLKQSLWQLSPACREHANTVAVGLKDTLHACEDDMLVHCSRADIAGGRGSQCLTRKPGLSPGCTTLVNLLRKG